ncbi:MAG: hypothetical protein V3V95_05090 [Thermodesulfobacteriota bacterium]
MFITSREKIAVQLLYIFFCILILGLSSAKAAEISVPADYPTIQGAIDKSSPGDIVIVSDGLYKENIVIKAPVVLRSRNGALKTIIEPVEPKNDIVTV